jgi:hypothetical protein
MAGSLQEAAQRVTTEFNISKEDLAGLVAEFLKEMGETVFQVEAVGLHVQMRDYNATERT